jgi:hypothetical protein
MPCFAGPTRQIHADAPGLARLEIELLAGRCEEHAAIGFHAVVAGGQIIRSLAVQQVAFDNFRAGTELLRYAWAALRASHAGVPPEGGPGLFL